MKDIRDFILSEAPDALDGVVEWIDAELEKEKPEGIIELETPQEISTEIWLIEHMGCDAIIDDYGSRIVVYAFATVSIILNLRIIRGAGDIPNSIF